MIDIKFASQMPYPNVKQIEAIYKYFSLTQGNI